MDEAKQNIRILKVLRAWLEKNPNKSALVDEEVRAITWVLRQIGEK